LLDESPFNDILFFHYTTHSSLDAAIRVYSYRVLIMIECFCVELIVSALLHVSVRNIALIASFYFITTLFLLIRRCSNIAEKLELV
jgi:hypothetical protein